VTIYAMIALNSRAQREAYSPSRCGDDQQLHHEMLAAEKVPYEFGSGLGGASVDGRWTSDDDRE
jgi:hypothetical protein